jgi:hypothetical protein
MGHSTFLAIALASVSCFAQSPAPQPASFLTALQKMPSQVRGGTFDQQAFDASQTEALADANLDVAAACHLLEADLADSNSTVNFWAFASLGNLMRRKSNSDSDRQILGSTLFTCIDRSNESSQNVCVSLVTDYGIPMSILAQFKDAADRKIADGTAYPALAVGLGLLATRRQIVNADTVLADFFSSPRLPDTVKAKAIFSLQNMPLSDQVLDAVAELLSKTKNDELKLQIIQISQKLGGRAMEREHNTLLALEANLSENEHVRQAAGYALRASPQADTAIPGIH